MALNWFTEMASFLGGRLPVDYVVIDTETTGGAPLSDRCLPIQLGWLVVEDCKPTHHGQVVLDWTKDGYAVGDIETWMSQTRYNMNLKGLHYPFNAQYLRHNGVDPAEALACMAGMMTQAVSAGYWLVGHNILGYDIPLLNRAFVTHCGLPDIVATRVLDTMLIEKSRLLKQPPPLPGSMPLSAWYVAMRKGRVAGCGLDTCIKTYSLPVDPQAAHDAGADVLTNHKLVEAMRRLGLSLSSVTALQGEATGQE